MGGSRFLGRRLLVEPLRIFVGFARYLVDPLSELRALKNFGGLGHLLLRICHLSLEVGIIKDGVLHLLLKLRVPGQRRSYDLTDQVHQVILPLHVGQFVA
jgi:hypothetical protein